MPNNEPDCPHQQDIAKKANDGRAHLKKFTDAHPDLALDMDLQKVDEHLAAIAMDNHKAR
jgi:hypothetical protein